MENVKQEHGGLADDPLTDIAHSLRDLTVTQMKQTLLTLVSSIDDKNAGHCLSMISSFCTSSLDVLTALVPELVVAPKKKRRGLNIYSGEMQPYVSEGSAEIGGPVSTMMNNETFGASILSQAMAAVGPLVQSQQARSLAAALASAKEAKLGVEIVNVLESSLKSALGVDVVLPEPIPVPEPMIELTSVPKPLYSLTEELVGALPREED